MSQRSVRRRCGLCGLSYLEAPGCPCPRCAPDADPGEFEGRRRSDWVPIHAYADEWTALSLEAEIRGHGILCWRRCVGVPGYMGLLGVNSAHWGWILVDREDAASAEEIVRNVLVAARVTLVGKDESR